jgi:hypothetical protein
LKERLLAAGRQEKAALAATIDNNQCAFKALDNAARDQWFQVRLATWKWLCQGSIVQGLEGALVIVNCGSQGCRPLPCRRQQPLLDAGLQAGAASSTLPQLAGAPVDISRHTTKVTCLYVVLNGCHKQAAHSRPQHGGLRGRGGAVQQYDW